VGVIVDRVIAVWRGREHHGNSWDADSRVDRSDVRRVSRAGGVGDIGLAKLQRQRGEGPDYVLAQQEPLQLGALLSVLASRVRVVLLRVLAGLLPTSTWPGMAAPLFFGGAIVFGVGGALAAGLDATAGDHPASLSAGSLQLLNTLSMDLNSAAVAVGLGVLYLSAGFIIYKSRALPVWLAWVSWLLGFLAATFVLAFIALIATVLWVLYVSILLAIRNPSLNIRLPLHAGSDGRLTAWLLAGIRLRHRENAPIPPLPRTSRSRSRAP
jgi:hypothetical protein